MKICIDFDGTCTTHDFPRVGKDIGSIPVLKRLVEAKHELILFTMRSDQGEGKNYLTDAVNWFKQNNIPLFGIQTNPEQGSWTSSPKAYGQVYIDDASLGCPLKFDSRMSRRPFVNWENAEAWLERQGILEPRSYE